MIKKLLPKKRPIDAHKGTSGKVLVIAGSPGMTGAAILASRGALRSGAGLVYLAVPKELVNFVDPATPEVITREIDQIFKNDLFKANAIAVGPGLTTSRHTNKLIHQLVFRSNCPLVIDADGLNSIASNPDILRRGKVVKIITPHPGEFSRLTGLSIKHIQSNRLSIAKSFARDFNVIVVLKGAKTVVASPNVRPYINSTGNPGMASGGVGDVLTGMIASFIAQGVEPFKAAVLGVYLHGLAGDMAAKEKGPLGMIASDLLEKIPDAIRKTYTKN